MKSVTMREVAIAAGVSSTTVSHYLNASRPVHPATATAIDRAISQTGYVFNGVARSLATARTPTIGLAVPAIANPYLGKLVRAVDKRLKSVGYTLLLSDTDSDGDGERKSVNVLRQNRIGGLLLISSLEKKERLDLTRSISGLPTVLLDQVSTTFNHVDQIGVDNYESVKNLVIHLGKVHNHKEIAFIGANPKLETTIERRDGYLAGLNAMGLQRKQGFSIVGPETVSESYHAAKLMLTQRQRPTALVTGTAYLAIGALRAIKELSLEIPNEVAIATFDDVEWTELLPAPLTAIEQPYAEMADAAVSRLFARFDDHEDEIPYKLDRFKTNTVYRQSCGCGRET